ncbi:MAG: superoxide dismutase family protein [Eubacteriales bacterium]
MERNSLNFGMMRGNAAFPSAIAYVRGGTDAPRLVGTVKFYQLQGGVLVEAEIYGLPSTDTSGFFGFHIHGGPGCSGEGFSGTGSHYNPRGVEHPLHAGDLPPLLSSGGRAYMAVMTDRFRVSDIIGKTVVIHSSPDDFVTQPAGNSGKKIACGEIIRVN